MEDDENIIFNIEQFQKHVYSIFKDKGLLSGLKTHLRHCMVEALKTTKIGQQLIFQQCNNIISPKYQALNILIAEYLFNQHYHFTLSVFSSEVPMHSCLPEFIKIVLPLSNEKQKSKDKVNTKLEERDVFDILESFGIPQDTDFAQRIYSAYQNSPEDALLLCLIRTLAPFLREILPSTKKTNVCRSCIDKIDYEDLLKVEKENFAIEFKKNMQKLFNHEILIVKNVERTKYEKCLKRAEVDYNVNLQEFLTKEQQLKSEITNLKKVFENKLLAQKTEYDTEKQYLQESYRVMIEENKNSMKNMLRLQNENVALSLKKVKVYAEKLKKKEENLNKKIKDVELTSKNDTIQPITIFQSPHEDKHFIEKIEKDLEKTKAEIYEVIKSITNSQNNQKLRVSKEVQTDNLLFTSVKTNTEWQIFNKSGQTVDYDLENVKNSPEKAFNDLKKMIKALHKENTYLKAFNSQQRKQIQDLIKNQTSMKKEVTRSYSELNLLNNQLEVIKKYSPKTDRKTKKINVTRIMSAPSTLNRERKLNYELQSSKCVSTRSLTHNNQMRQTMTADSDDEYFKKRYMKKLKQLHQNRSEDESSPTEEVLTEVKKRLKRIEKESEEVEKSFQEFKKRQAENMKYNAKMKNYAAIAKPIQITSNTHQNIYNESYQDHFDYNEDFENIKMHRVYGKAEYNIMKRAQSPFMNCDNTLLHNYIQTARKSYRQNINQIPKSPLNKSINQQNGGTVNILPTFENSSLSIYKTSPTKNWMKLYNGKTSSLKRYTFSSWTSPESQVQNSKNKSNTVTPSYKASSYYKSLINNYKLNNQIQMKNNENVLSKPVDFLATNTFEEGENTSAANKIVLNEINKKQDEKDLAIKIQKSVDLSALIIFKEEENINVLQNKIPSNEISNKRDKEELIVEIHESNNLSDSNMSSICFDIDNKICSNDLKENNLLNQKSNNVNENLLKEQHEFVDENTEKTETEICLNSSIYSKIIKEDGLSKAVENNENMSKPFNADCSDNIHLDKPNETIENSHSDDKKSESNDKDIRRNNLTNNLREMDELEKSQDLITFSNESTKLDLSLEVPENSDNNDSFWKD